MTIKQVDITVITNKSILLDEADISALTVMLLRDPKYAISNLFDIPQFKVYAIKYLKARFSLSLLEAKRFMDEIDQHAVDYLIK